MIVTVVVDHNNEEVLVYATTEQALYDIISTHRYPDWSVVTTDASPGAQKMQTRRVTCANRRTQEIKIFNFYTRLVREQPVPNM